MYGLIFLFKWTEERKSRRKATAVEENFVFNDEFIEDMFFAQQVKDFYHKGYNLIYYIDFTTLFVIFLTFILIIILKCVLQSQKN